MTLTRDEALAKLKQWEAVFKRATPEPWLYNSDDEEITHGFGTPRAEYICVPTGENRDHDMLCVAFSRTALPALVRLGIDELERHAIHRFCGVGCEDLGRCDTCLGTWTAYPCPTVERWCQTVEEISK